MLDGDSQHNSGVSHDVGLATKPCCPLFLFCRYGTRAQDGALLGSGLLAAQHNKVLSGTFLQDCHTMGFNIFCI